MTNRALTLPLPDQPGAISNFRRTSSIEEALTWPTGTIENKLYTTVYESGAFRIALGKPGKETSPDFKKINVNDMTPTVFYNGRPLDFFPTFGDIFRDIWHLGKEAVEDGEGSESVFEIVGALFYRCSYMLDHEMNTLRQRSRSGSVSSLPWVWSPPASAMERICDRMEFMGRTFQTSKGDAIRLPVDVYFQLVDALALNEDVKYQAENVQRLGKVAQGIGRQNTMQTCASMIAVYLDRYDVVTLFDKLSRNKGVASMSQKDARQVFPILA